MDLFDLFGPIVDLDIDSEYVPEKTYVYRNCSRKLKKAIKNWPHSKNTKWGRYIDSIFYNEYEYYYVAGGEVMSDMQYISDKHYLIVDMIKGKSPYKFRC